MPIYIYVDYNLGVLFVVPLGVHKNICSEEVFKVEFSLQKGVIVIMIEI